MHDSPRTCVQVRIHGRVQGVFYRAWTVKAAQRLGLAGWVRNRRDGTVEALFCGPRAAVEEMLRLAHDGPPAARVDRIEAEEVVAGEVAGAAFQVLPTV